MLMFEGKICSLGRAFTNNFDDLFKKDYVRDEFKKPIDIEEWLRKHPHLDKFEIEREKEIFEEEIERRIVSLKMDIERLEREKQ
jgi:hypothetical protein